MARCALQWREAEIAAVLAVPLLVSVVRAQTPQANAGLTEIQAMGRQTLAQSCGICHLRPVRNSPTFGPMLHSASAAGSEDVWRALIINGTDRMPSFKYHLKPAEIDAIIAYLKTVPAPAAAAPAAAK